MHLSPTVSLFLVFLSILPTYFSLNDNCTYLGWVQTKIFRKIIDAFLYWVVYCLNWNSTDIFSCYAFKWERNFFIHLFIYLFSHHSPFYTPISNIGNFQSFHIVMNKFSGKNNSFGIYITHTWHYPLFVTYLKGWGWLRCREVYILRVLF